MIEQQIILNDIKTAVQWIDKSAVVTLFGSRARGDAKDDSDWDVLILTNKKVDKDVRWAFRKALFELELKHNVVINSLTRNKKAWDNQVLSPIHKNIKADGITL